MGLTYAELRLTNLFGGKNVLATALVDTGAMHMCVPSAIATQLGFDVEESPTLDVTVADGRRVTVARIGPIKIEFENRSYMTEAFVIGDEPLLGVLPIEAMDLIVDPVNKRLRVNPEHPERPVFPVKGFRI